MTTTARPGRGPAYGAGPRTHCLAERARASSSWIEWVQDRLTERDWQIIEAVNALRILSGEHIQALFFSSLPSLRSRVVSRARVLRRLVGWRVLMSLERRIGGAGRGSTAAAFVLDSVGQKLIAVRQHAAGQPSRVRRPGTPGERSLKHTLAVSELFVRLVMLSRSRPITVAEFQAEPGCWWPNGLGGFIKPDAYLRLETAELADHWWIEQDQATESLPTLRSKLGAYLDFVGRGQLGPHGVVPRVLISVISEGRAAAVAELVHRLPAPADRLFIVVPSQQAAEHLCTLLLA